jgi:hypothetical protein
MRDDIHPLFRGAPASTEVTSTFEKASGAFKDVQTR